LLSAETAEPGATPPPWKCRYSTWPPTSSSPFFGSAPWIGIAAASVADVAKYGLLLLIDCQSTPPAIARIFLRPKN
jgi:hypothetical protein